MCVGQGEKPAIAPDNPNSSIPSPAVRETLPAGLLSQLQAALAQSPFWVFALMFVLAFIGLATMFLLPGGQAEQYAYKGEGKTEDSAESETMGLKPEITTIG